MRGLAASSDVSAGDGAEMGAKRVEEGANATQRHSRRRRRGQDLKENTLENEYTEKNRF